jgi:tetratricopeptide (TPR) repeat protein
MRSVLVITAVVLTAATALAQAPDLDLARRHFEAGSQAYDRKDYAAAETAFWAAFTITKDPLLYYNIGQAQQRQGHAAAAVSSYRLYLLGVPDAEDRAEVRRIIEALELELRSPVRLPPSVTAAQPVGPATSPASQPEARRNTRRLAAWITGGGAVALLATGVAMSAVSRSKANDANSLLTRRGTDGQPLPFAEVASQYDSAKNGASAYGGVAIGMYAAAAVAGGLGVYLLMTSRRAESSSEASRARWQLVPEMSPRRAGLVAGTEF